MNKIFKSMMAVAITAFTFTACEDVPEPYNNPYDSIKPAEPEVVIEPAGTGTVTDPYNIAKALQVCKEVGETGTTEDVYAKGIITSISEIDTGTYGNATFMISDDSKGTNTITVYRAYAGKEKKFTSDTEIAVGDTVVIAGKLVNYKSNTPEFTQGCYIYSLKKGEGGSSEQLEAPGTEEAPLTVAEALTYIDKLGADKQSPVGFVKGKICAIGEVDTGQYGNATYSISDDGTENNALQIYRGYSLGGEKFKSADEIKVGDEVIITGKLVNFKGNTKQFAQGSQIVELNGQKAGSDEKPEPVVTGDNILANGDFEAWTSGQPDNWKSGNTASSATLTQSTDAHAGTYAVKVGHDASGNKRLAYKELTLRPGTYAVSFYVKAADAAGASVNPGYTSTGSDSKLSYNYDGYVNDITTEWQQVTYNFTLSAETVVNLIVMVPKNSGTDVIIDDFTLATSDGGIVGGGEEKPDTPTGDKGTSMDNPYNIAEALAAINALEDNGYSEAEVYVKGKVVKVTTNQTNFEKYGNLNYLISEDGSETNTITVYSGDGLNGAKFTGIGALSQGDEVIVYGKLQKYVKNDNVTPEIAKGNYLVSLKSAGDNDNNTGSSTTGTFENPLTASQAYDLVAAMEKGVTSTEDYYVKGKITSIKYTFSADYGTATFNFSDDGTANGKEFIAYSTYYFGAEQKWAEGNTQVQVGDEVIVCGKVVNYNGNTPEFASKKSYIVKLNSQTAASRRH